MALVPLNTLLVLKSRMHHKAIAVYIVAAKDTPIDNAKQPHLIGTLPLIAYLVLPSYFVVFLLIRIMALVILTVV